MELGSPTVCKRDRTNVRLYDLDPQPYLRLRDGLRDMPLPSPDNAAPERLQRSKHVLRTNDTNSELAFHDETHLQVGPRLCFSLALHLMDVSEEQSVPRDTLTMLRVFELELVLQRAAAVVHVVARQVAAAAATDNPHAME